MTKKTSIIIFSIIIVFNGCLAAIEGNPFEQSSREEMVKVAGYGEDKLSTVLVTGSVICETCLHGEPQLRSWPIKGAMVAVICDKKEKRRKASCSHSASDEYGEFMIDLPSNLHAIPNLEKTCEVKVVGVPKKSMCRPASINKHTRMTLSSVGNGIRTYNAGEIRFMHLTSRPLDKCLNNGGDDKTWDH